MEKLCTNCKHAELRAKGNRFARCKAEQNAKTFTDQVDGKITTKYRFEYCSSLRRYGFFESRIFRTCGREGRWFQPKEEE